MMKKRYCIKLFSFLLALLSLVLAIPFSAFAADVPELGAIGTSNVEEDMKKWGYAITDYPKDVSATHCRMLNFLEYGYDYYGNHTNYGLYVYIYNPSGKQINVSEGKNYIQMQVRLISNKSEEGSGFSKYKLKLCSYSTTQGYEHVWYKFQVENVSGFLSKLARDYRHYDISGVELHMSGDTKATDYHVGGLYSFRGFMPYCNQLRNPKNSLQQDVTDRVAIDIELHPVTWKTETSDKGNGYQYEVFSVYYSVPNDIIEKYGDPNNVTKGLVQVDGVFSEYKMNGVVTSNTTLYNWLREYYGVNANANEIPFYFTALNRGYNLDDNPLNYDSLMSLYTNIGTYGVYLESSSEFEGISSEDFKNKLYEIKYEQDGLLVSHNVDSGCTPGYQPYSVKAGEDLSKSIASFASSHSKFLSWLSGVGNLYIEDENYGEIKSIEAISESDLKIDSAFKSDAAIAEEFFMEESDVNGFVDFVSEEAKDDKTTFLLRFAVRDYFCPPAEVYEQDGLLTFEFEKMSGTHYYFEKTVFFDFDILTFTWEDQYSRRTVIPVVCSPIDVVGSITPSRNPSIIGSMMDKAEDTVDNLKDLWDKLAALKPWILLIFGLIILALVCFVLSKLGIPIGWLFKGIGAIFSAPFKLAKSIGDKNKERKEERKRESEEYRKQEEHEWKRQDRMDKSMKDFKVDEKKSTKKSYESPKAKIESEDEYFKEELKKYNKKYKEKKK